MAYIGKTPASAALTSSDISDGIIITDKLANNAVVTSKITDGTISNADISSTVITGQTAITGVANDDLVLISDTSGSAALKKMTVANLVANAGGGKVLQVVSATRTAFQTIATATATYTDLTGLSVAITPSATSSKVLIMFSVSVGQNSGGSAMARIIIDRGGSTILQGDASGSRTRGGVNAGIGLNSNYVMQVLSQQYLDSPSSTSELTYKLRAGGFSSRQFRINETVVDAAEGATASSTITVMEIGA